MTGPLPVGATNVLPRRAAASPRPRAAQIRLPPTATPTGSSRSRAAPGLDFEAAERAEILREHEILQTMLMAHLKNEDEITKKWIALI